MSSIADKMSQAGSGRPVTKENEGGGPKKGDRFRCTSCGMEIQVTADCGCPDADHVHFQCCGRELQKVS